MQLKWIPFVALALTGTVGCDSDEQPPTGEDSTDGGVEATRQQVIENLTDSVALPQIEACDAAADDLVSAASAWVAAGNTGSSETVEAAFTSLWSEWQRCELLLLGPAGKPDQTEGGEALRDLVYNYPLEHQRCYLDIALTGRTWESANYESLLPTRVGLESVEYLLYAPFSDDASTTCSSGQPINEADGSGESPWQAMGAETRDQHRRELVEWMAQGVAAATQQLLDRWNGEDGYAVQLKSAGSGSDLFDSSQDVLNEFSNAMFYLEVETKDMKLALPLGISGTTTIACEEDICPDDLESHYAQLSFEAIEANLDQFEQIYLGGEGAGFDDLLLEIGAETVDQHLRDGIATTRASLEALEADSFADALTSDVEGVEQLFADMRDTMAIFKTEFVTVLGLELPMRAAGDND